ncbi:MAG: hypothetical protein L3K26_01250 [Candidatus Hydrogenedentes bacterium]|nr:hypothetical protein [Candidatus Hydrogenedentota bacterium]
MKTLHTLALAAIVGLALSACNPTEAPTPDPEPAESAPVEAAPAPEAPAESTPAPDAGSDHKKMGAMWMPFFNGKNLDGGTRIPATFTDSGQRSRRPMIVPPG